MLLVGKSGRLRAVNIRNNSTAPAVDGVLYASGTRSALLNLMISNPWINRFAVLVLMFAVYVAGISTGREQTVLTAQNTPVCQQVFKP